ncbi:uncharacterized protein LOC117146587 [Drosophila mauritiana]|uniref:Uncharacterized protein LOC117146587 n=1 Tax=Drosophila mauritiana TaxID=7226 RepID=A0A6P8KY98_DROMA|nr:uncharacterized protein LOC117146587 [Drosophila mauritiana]
MPKHTPYTWRQPDFPGDESDVAWKDPTLLVICQNADVAKAMQPLIHALKQPFAPGLVVSVFVHETMRDSFCDQVRNSMERMHHQAASHSTYVKAVEMINCLQAEVVSMLTPDDIRFQFRMSDASPVIVCEFDHSFFGGSRPSSVVTLHTFRNATELPRLLATERVPFVSVAVWGSHMATVYEAALQLDISVVYINCHGISLTPIKSFLDAGKPHVVLAQYHHFEVILHGGKHRAIVYPAIILGEPPVRASAGSDKKSAKEEQRRVKDVKKRDEKSSPNSNVDCYHTLILKLN